MSLKLTPPAGSKNEQQSIMQPRYVIVSRIKDDWNRDLMGDGEEYEEEAFFFDEQNALQEYAWWTSKYEIREYFLFRITPKKGLYDDLDDDIKYLL